jgi:uncharacterized CHY-type Zn-finger protein
MIACAYCEHPLVCDGCQTEYLPPTQEHYEALSRREDVIICPECKQILTCHWCKTPYDGAPDEVGGEGEGI